MFEKFEKLNHDDIRSSYDQLKDFIFRMEEKQFENGEEMVNNISSSEELRDHNERILSQVVERMGGFVEAPLPLHAKTVKIREEKDLTLETIIYQSCDNVWVTASLYIPKGIPMPAPAVYFIPGHTYEGRMDADYQTVCRILAKAGLIVFATDTLGQGERGDFYEPEKGTYRIDKGSVDHDACGYPAVAVGECLERYFICDQIRAIDYMLTRPEIDPERIGVTGCSGGGTQTVVMMMCDKRIAAAAPATYVTNRRELMYTGICDQDAEEIWPGSTELGFDHVNPFLIFAPKPVAILAVTSDFFPIEGTRETYQTAKRFYEMYGKPENIRMYEDDYIHCYTTKLGVCAAEFFTEVFYGEKVTVDPSEIETIPVEEMRATKGGNVLGDIQGAVSVADHIHDHAIRLREARTALPAGVRRQRAKDWLQEKVMHHRQPVAFDVRKCPKEEGCRVIDGYIGIPVSWWTQKRLFSYGLLIKREGYYTVNSMPTTIAVWTEGTKEISKHEEWIREQCDAGRQVLVLDVPGVGNVPQAALKPGQKTGDRKGVFYRLEADLVFAGDSLAAMRVYDVLRAIEMLQSEFGVMEEDIALYCAGEGGVYGVMAAFLNEKVPVACGEDILTDLEYDLFGKDKYPFYYTMQYIIPGMLEYFDYYELLED